MAYLLLAIREVSTWSEERRHKCEVAYLLDMPLGRETSCSTVSPGARMKSPESGTPAARRRWRSCAQRSPGRAS
jgi:hypothetical protein